MKKFLIAASILTAVPFCSAMHNRQQQSQIKLTQLPSSDRTRVFVLTHAASPAIQQSMSPSLEEEISQFLSPKGITENFPRPRPLTQEMIYKQLVTFINHDGINEVRSLINHYSPYNDPQNPEPNIIDIAQQRIAQFKFFAEILKHNSINAVLNDQFIQHHNTALTICELLKNHCNAALFDAIKSIDAKRVLLLLGAGTRLSWIDNNGGNAFSYLRDAYKALFEQFTNLEKINNELIAQRDALFIAAIMAGNYTLVQEMVSVGASPYLKIEHGENALQVADLLTNDPTDPAKQTQYKLIHTFLCRAASNTASTKFPSNVSNDKPAETSIENQMRKIIRPIAQKPSPNILAHDQKIQTHDAATETELYPSCDDSVGTDPNPIMDQILTMLESLSPDTTLSPLQAALSDPITDYKCF